MGTVPKRSKLALLYRQPLHVLEQKMPFPIKNPNVYQVLGLLLSLLFLVTPATWQQIILLIVILIFDWFDGATARKHKLMSREGYLIDVFVDRLSEGLIFFSALFTPIGKVFFALYLVNNFLAFYSIKTGKHYSLALRFFYLAYLVAILVWR